MRAYSRAYLSGDGRGARALLSKRCKSRISAAAMNAATARAKQTYGNLPLTSFTVNALAGDLARVTYTFAVPALTQDSEPWVREGGSWHEDDC